MKPFTPRFSVRARVAAASLAMLFLLTLPASAQAPAAPAWEPAKTWVFAVGVLEWKDASFTKYPQEGRSDAKWIALLKKRGVPAEQIVYLKDQQATKKRIEESLPELLRKTRKGDFLIVYYAGHGCRNRTNGATYFANYDATGDLAKNFWPVSGIYDAIERDFKGSHVLLTADSCHSGALGEAAAKRKTSIAYACLASVDEHGTSTGNWTFTDCLLRGFGGDGALDSNRDGHVTLAELAAFTEEEMALTEKQRASWTTSKNFDGQLRVATAGKTPAVPRRRQVEVEWEGQWYRAEVLAEKKDEFRIHYLGYDDTWDEWVTPKRMRAFALPAYTVGAAVMVRWEGKWYPAKVLESWKGLHRIHFDNFEDEWDEWVGPERIKKK